MLSDVGEEILTELAEVGEDNIIPAPVSVCEVSSISRLLLAPSISAQCRTMQEL